ncbi:hypothetical protein [Macrococcus sp. DPC7161]|uniref:hypothetical protein n=1 Tax=Macrococcus sp. DPC7161 TaxID=2507060 RepID=UPI00100C06D9|nr:hypothetical protein [Macrococcus sp. DPC7161]RXK17175.1 hypothetical protein ER639_11840 [Macrococcus sp. DPC7161]
MKIDKRLLSLQSYLYSRNLDIEIHDYIGVSKRQLSRLLNTWQDNGYIEYSGGSGRGRKLEITMKIDAEKELFYYAIQNAKNMELQELQEYINLPWHEESRESVIQALIDEFYDKEHTQGFLLDYVFDIPERLYKNMSHDTVSSQIFENIAETLYVYNKGEVEYQLVKYDEWVDNALHIHLTKDAYFDDNVQMTSKEVVSVINDVYKRREFHLHFQMIRDIEIINDFHFVIYCTHAVEHLKFLLSEPYAAILREEDGVVHGTGKYCVHKYDKNEIVLNVNPYNKRQPQIKKIFLVKNQSKIRDVYNVRNRLTSIRFAKSNGLLVCNPKTCLTKEERLSFINAFVPYMQKLLEQENREFDWLYQPFGDHQIKLTKPIKFLSNNFNYPAFQKIFDKMEKELGVKVDHKMVDHEIYLKTPLEALDTDFLFMMETYMQENPIKFYDLMLNCKCKEWLLQYSDCESFIRYFDLNEKEKMNMIADNVLSKLEEEGLFIELYLKYRYFYFPSYIHYIEVNQYGFIKYHSAIIE